MRKHGLSKGLLLTRNLFSAGPEEEQESVTLIPAYMFLLLPENAKKALAVKINPLEVNSIKVN